MSRARDLANLGSAYSGENSFYKRNLIINGEMKLSQRSTSATGLGNSNGFNALDRFGYFGSSSGRFTKSQESITDLTGFSKALKLTCTTADTSIAASEYLHLNYGIEGQDVQKLQYNTANARDMKLSFYVKGNASATYTFRAQTHPSGGTARWFGKEFSVTTSWTRVEIDIPGDTDTSAGHGIDDNQNLGLQLIWYLHGGTNYSSGTFTESTWEDRDYTKALGDNQTSFYDSTSRTFFLTGVQLEMGNVATAFEHEKFYETLKRCQRYFYQIPASNAYTQFGSGQGFATNSGVIVIEAPCQMRAVPSIVASSSSSYAFFEANAVTALGGGPSIDSGCGRTVLAITGTTSGGINIGDALNLIANNDDEITLSFAAEIT